MNTATVHGGGTAGVTYTPASVAPAAHSTFTAPAAHNLPLAPAGRLVIPAPEQSSGLGIHADHNV